ncbi:hypothetical protein U1Q18_024133 [Sarracenia purpurea var. burkii]
MPPESILQLRQLLGAPIRSNTCVVASSPDFAKKPKYAAQFPLQNLTVRNFQSHKPLPAI